ncbi:MAG: hypothetical protein UW58_C0011G0005 [Candidatus Collierbacteria bacterium GW2011_GWC2_44_30]|nr:MAG: hypothetical protein UW58_C0011G0005 [Candidatus Collierbacteria bacterium GW2011_GWC2_44_30]
MFKNIIAPVQAWLLSRGTCVGCGTSLTEGTSKPCKCGRVFVHNPKTNTYRRALLSEI